jgi:hypothetical protein
MYIQSSLKYVRRKVLENTGLHIIIIDLISNIKLRIINMYRPINPLGNILAREFFQLQLNLIKAAYTNDSTILLGDFNLDWTRRDNIDYAFRSYFEDFDEAMSGKTCIQLVNFPTWSRVVNGVHRESAIDHIYTPNPCQIRGFHNVKPYFGDHSAIMFEYNIVKPKPVTTIRRNWKNYSQNRLLNMLGNVNWNLQGDLVQDCWNELENKLISIVDDIVPLTEFSSNTMFKLKIPTEIKNLINIRKRLLKRFKQNKNPE